MSMRTIVEFNHDYLRDLSAVEMRDLIRGVIDMGINAELADGRAVHVAPGVRVLARRHHRDALLVKTSTGCTARKYREPESPGANND